MTQPKFNARTGNTRTGNARTGNARTGALAAAVILLWASAFVAVRLALEELSAQHLALSRYAVAAAAFLLLIPLRALFAERAPAGSGRSGVPARADLGRLIAAGAAGIAFYNLALNRGQESVSAGVASLLVNTVPIWTVLLSRALLGERMTRAACAGTAIAFAGVGLIALRSQGGPAGAEGTAGGPGGLALGSGAIWVLAAAASQALYFVILKPLLTRYHPIELTAWVVWCGSLFLLPFSPGLFEALSAAGPGTLAAVVFLGLGPAVLAYIAWSYVLAALPAGRAANLLFMVPVAAIALEFLVLGEVPAPSAVVGGALAIAGVAVSRRRSYQE